MDVIHAQSSLHRQSTSWIQSEGNNFFQTGFWGNHVGRNIATTMFSNNISFLIDVHKPACAFISSWDIWEDRRWTYNKKEVPRARTLKAKIPSRENPASAPNWIIIQNRAQTDLKLWGVFSIRSEMTYHASVLWDTVYWIVQHQSHLFCGKSDRRPRPLFK